MAGALVPASPEWIPEERLLKYSNLVKQLNLIMPDIVGYVKSIISNLESLNLSTRDLDTRYHDFEKDHSLHMFLVRNWTWVSQRRKSRTTSSGSSPTQHLAAIHENSEILQQEIDRCRGNCQLFSNLVFVLQHWGRAATDMIEDFLFYVKNLSNTTGQIRAEHAVMPPHVSLLSQREACNSESDSNFNNSFCHSDASDVEFGDDDEDDIKSFRDLTSKLADTMLPIQRSFNLMSKSLNRTRQYTTQFVRKCESKVNPEVRIKPNSLPLKNLLEKMKHALAQTTERSKLLHEAAEPLIKLQGLHHDLFQKLLQRSLFIYNHSATIRQMKLDLNDLYDLDYPSDSDLLNFCEKSVTFLNIFYAW